MVILLSWDPMRDLVILIPLRDLGFAYKYGAAVTFPFTSKNARAYAWLECEIMYMEESDVMGAAPKLCV